MAVVIEREEWRLSPFSYVFLFACCFFSMFFLPYFSRGGGGAATRATTTASALFDIGPTAPFLRFQRSFLLLYSLASGGAFHNPVRFPFRIASVYRLPKQYVRISVDGFMEGLETVLRESEFTHHATSREQMVLALSAGTGVALVLGFFTGILSDVIGPRKICFCFCFLHLLVGVLKSVTKQPSVFLTSTCISLASTLFSFCFETLMVTEHEKQGHRMDLLSDSFWLMTLFESSSFVGSQGLANLLTKDLQKGFLSPSAPTALLAIISIFYMRKECNGNHQISTFGSYRKSFSGHILSVLLALQADGREVQLSHIYPCFLGSRMFGSTVFSWFLNSASPLHIEDLDYLPVTFATAGLVLSVVAYDYQALLLKLI
ncbi:hypothetical protein AXF42_Ash014459 [Apostasia shenzhenica]|uniref:Molybdate-anion transporter n=1 Tax=Apostasia shenzhenica TaxID=1088818 RepID=A0A2H9ZWN9_9ASPA|nr:hypothetical protein AXF42_Ash014459 [Apostasia shenzhenica]